MNFIFFLGNYWPVGAITWTKEKLLNLTNSAFVVSYPPLSISHILLIHNRLLVWFSVALDFLGTFILNLKFCTFISHKLSRQSPPLQVVNGE